MVIKLSSTVTASALKIPRLNKAQLETSSPNVSNAPQIKLAEENLSTVSNADFVSLVFDGKLPDGTHAAVCSKSGDPTSGGWVAKPADKAVAELSGAHNNYVNCSSFKRDNDGSLKARKENFSACHFVMLDDIGTKVPLDRFKGFKLSWLIETSPGNYQGGIIFATPISDEKEAARLLAAIIAASLCDKGASGPSTRWARLPVAVNGKDKHTNADGSPFKCRLAVFDPNARYSVQEIVDGLELNFDPRKTATMEAVGGKGKSRLVVTETDDIFKPMAEVNPVIAALKKHGLYKTPLGSGKHDITCPWVHEHTDGIDGGSAYFEPGELHPIGGYRCQHSHGDKYRIKQLAEHLELPIAILRNKPVIRVVEGELNRVVNAAEKVLAARGHHFQYGGLIVSVTTNPVTGDPNIQPTSAQALTNELSQAAAWEKYDGRVKDWIPCDPPARHVGILFDAHTYNHLPVLAGVVRQPYFRESDGELITHQGYDASSQLFGVFDASQFVIPEPTKEAAQAALSKLEVLLEEFHFVSPTDKAAALAAILTAVVRPTLAYAPAFHVHAPVFGSGKTFLCELIGAFAGPGGNAKVSYPTTSEEATKVILSLLLTNPAVIEFDDMDTDWIPHGTIKRMLTADKITDRILGVSKTATVSTRTLFLGSGNNVGPVRDLLRRVLTIHVDPRCATPATMSYKGQPVSKVRNNRAEYVAAVLTIILAWRKAGSPRTNTESIVTFSGSWSDYCRYPLMWLGHADPATSLLEQVKQDPDAATLHGLMSAWKSAFGSTPTTVRKAVGYAIEGQLNGPDLLDAMREFPIEERGEINRSKLGWLLKRNAGRVVAGYMFEKASADGRAAWRVVAANSKASPPSAADNENLEGLPIENDF